MEFALNLHLKNDKYHIIAGGSLTMTGRQLSSRPGARYPEGGSGY